MSEYWQGVVTPFAVVGALLATGGLIWLVVVLVPEGVWWTAKRLPLADPWARDRAAAVVAGSRRAYILRIPLGVRVVVALGGDRDTQDEVLQQLHRGRQGSAILAEKE